MMRSVEALMSPAPFTAQQGELIGPVRDAMLDGGIHCLPVTDASGHAVGIVTSWDLVEEYSPQESVDNAMTPRVLTVGPHEDAAAAAAIMRANMVHHLVVVDEAADVIGVLSSLDLLAAFADA